MLARRALLCTLMFGGAIAHADRRSVAVIDMSNDPKTENLARELNPVLLGHPELQPLLDPALAAALYGEFKNDDNKVIEDVQISLQTAEDWLSRYDFGVALDGTNRGQAQLRQVVPTPSAMRLYAQLAFVNAQALLPRQPADALIAFALANRLDPSFIPDAARYLPDVVGAFDTAKRKWVGKGTVTVDGVGKLWVDGRDVPGAAFAPAAIELDAGPHVVWLTGDDREPAGQQILVEPGKKLKVGFAAAPADLVVKVRRARAELSHAQDPPAKATAMKKLADLLSRDNVVRDAVLLQSANGRIIYQTWNAGTREKAPGFSSLRELKNEKPIDLLAPLAPPKPKAAPKEFTFDKPVVDNRRWYERRTWQATIAVGVLASVISGYYIYKGLTDDDFGVDNEVSGVSRVTPLGVRW